MSFKVITDGPNGRSMVIVRMVADVDIYVDRLRSAGHTNIQVMGADQTHEPEPYDVWRQRQVVLRNTRSD